MGVVNLFESGDNEVSDEFFSRSQEVIKARNTVQVKLNITPILDKQLKKCAVEHGISKPEVIRMSLNMMMEAVTHSDWDEDEQ